MRPTFVLSLLLASLFALPPVPAASAPLQAASAVRSAAPAAAAPRPDAATNQRPALIGGETARYKIRYGAFGTLGQIEISLAAPSSEGRVRAIGAGSGSLLGFGAGEKRIETDFDPATASARTWTVTRVQDGTRVVDRVVQRVPGRLEMVRERADREPHAAVLSRGRPVLDPVALILKLRFAPPLVTETYEVLDGRLLWLVTVDPPRAEALAEGDRALRFDARAEPIAWDGARDGKRSARAITLHVSADSSRVPLRLAMPVGVAQVEVKLVSLDRARPELGATSWLGLPGRLLAPLGRAIGSPPARLGR